MKLIQWNVRGYFARLPFLQQILNDTSPDILCLQETFLRPCKTLKLSNFHNPPSRKDRTNREGGGVSVHIRNGIPHILADIDSELEVCAEKVFLPEKTLFIASLYLPPNLSNNDLTNQLDDLLRQTQQPVIICMDANAHHFSWGSEEDDRRGRILANWATDNNLVILNNSEPTFIQPNGAFSHIDLTMASADIAPTLSWRPLPDFPSSDHIPIMIESYHSAPAISGNPRWDFENADWPGYRKTLNLNLTFTSPTQACNDLEREIVRAAKLNIKIKDQAFKPEYSKCWWTSSCNNSNREMKQALHRYKRHKGDLQLWIDFKKKRAIFRKTIKEEKANSWRKYVQSINCQTSPTEVWRKVKRLSGSHSTRTIILRTGQGIITDDNQIATLLAEQFAKQCSGVTDNPIFLQHREMCESTPIHFTPGAIQQSYNKNIELSELIHSLDASKSKSPGPDFIPFELLKQMDGNQKGKLLEFFNYIWNNGFPSQWRYSTVVPLLKQGKPSNSPTSYRPIALTCCLCKIIERIANRRLQFYLESVGFLTPFQSGFRSGHSTLDPLARLESAIRRSLIQADCCVGVFLDISRAFDTVWHHGLLRKLSDMGLTGNLPHFIQEFLHDRKITVRYNNKFSGTLSTTSGVPQGSVISPTLFNIMINDLFQSCPDDVQFSLYADDGAMWCTKQSPADAAHSLQASIQTLSEWSNNWGLQISPSKTKAMIFSRNYKASIPPLLLDGQPIELVQNHRFLGLIFDRKLTWSKHISSVRERCQGTLRLLSVISSRGWGADLPTLKTLYESLILSKLEYASFLLDTASPSQLLILDRIQYAGIRTILSALKPTPVCTLEEECGLMPLGLKRRIQMCKYAIRMLSIRNHPTRDAIMEYYPFNFYNTSRYPLPVFGRIRGELEAVHIDKEHVASTPMTLRYAVPPQCCKTSLNVANKTDLAGTTWQSLFSNLKRSEYSNRVDVFTDGTRMDQKSGFGVFSENFQLLGRLPESSSVYTSELFAIYTAIKYISTQPGNYILWTDSLSCVTSLCAAKCRNHHLVRKIQHAISELEAGKVIIEWVPGHMGIQGNERADEIAKKSIGLKTVATWIAVDDAYKNINSYYLDQCKKHYLKNRLYNKTDPPTYETLPHHLLPRRQQIIISRLRLRTCLLTHGHFFTNSHRRQCQTCSKVLDLQHLLVDCPALSAHRSAIVSFCANKSLKLELNVLLSNNFPSLLLLRFLSDCKYTTEI